MPSRDRRRCSSRARCAALALAAGAGLWGCRVPSGPRHARPERHATHKAPFDVEHYALDLALDPARRWLEGTCTVRLWARERTLRGVELDLVGLSVGAVRDSTGRALGFRHEDGSLAIELAEPLPPGDFAELAVDYSGSPLRGLWFTDVEDGVPTQVFTQGQCDEARFWFPSHDVPGDRVTSELRVRMPAGWVATAAGERIERVEHGDGTASELWRMHQPHSSYLVTLVAGELVELEARHGDLPLTYLVEADKLGAVEGALGATGEVLDFMAWLAGRAYPYPKYSQACVEGFVMGGMENVSATTLTETLLLDERGLRDSDPVDLVAHEAAHQWFGNLVTCADWSQVWLNEGFATYATLLFYEARPAPDAALEPGAAPWRGGVDEFRARMRDAQETYLAGDVGAGRRPIVHDRYVDPLDLFFGGHTYEGGASRLHLLRFVVGDEAFLRGVRAFVAEHQHGTVTTDDLRSELEAASGLDLRRFFTQWLHSPGFPELEWGWRHEHGRVVVDVAQVQDPATTLAVFETPVDIELRFEAESRVERVTLDRRRQSFEFACDERPLWVHLDRLGWIPKTERVERPLEEWLAIAALDEDVNARRDAVDVLAGGLAGAVELDDRRQLALALVERLIEDSSRFVRARAAAGLGGERLEFVVEALCGAAGADPETTVRVAALDALALLGSDEGLAEFGRREFERGPSWATMTAAARLVAAADPERGARFLVEGLGVPSAHDRLRAGLVAALGRLVVEGRDPDGELEARLRTLALDERASEWTRLAALGGLVQAVRRDTALEGELTRLLERTRQHRLQTGLIELLAASRSPRVVPALEAFHARCHDPRQRRLIEARLREPWAR